MTLSIGIDCRALSRSRTGIGRYLYEVLREFAIQDVSVVFHLYTNKDIELPQECQGKKNFLVHNANVRTSFFWFHFVLPLYLWKHKADVFWGPNYAVPLLWFSKCRTVNTIHDLVSARFPETMHWRTRLHHRIFLRRYAKKVDTILADSESTKQDIIQYLGVENAKVRVVHLGNRLTHQMHVKLPNGVGSRPYILAVGTIEPRKNLRRVVEAFSLLQESVGSRYELVVVGAQGWGREGPTGWFTDCGVSSSSIYLGAVSDNELDALYQNAALFVFPSLYEGFGLPLLEAMARACPVLCSYTSSLGEVAGGNALLCDPYNVSDIRQKMQAILEDAALSKKLSLQGREWVKSFSWSRTAQRTLRHLKGDEPVDL